jgi:hypothetical protein
MRTSKQLVPLAVVFAALATAGPALAARGHVFKETFGERCIAQPCTGSQLKEPSGVAVNEATGDVYVVDKGEPGQHGRVVRFTATGAYISEFNGSGTTEIAGIPIEGKAAGSNGLPGEIPTGHFEEPEGIAIDNTCTQQKLTQTECETKDPSNEDIYIVDAGTKHRVVDKYTPTGEYLGQITEAGGVKFQSEGLDGVAVDTEGAVSVYREEPVLDVFTGANPNVFTNKAISFGGDGLGFPVSGPGNVAVDGQGVFYVRGGHSIAKADRTGKVLVQELEEEDSSAVAVDQSTDQSYIDNVTSVRVSEPDGTEAERLGNEAGAKHLVNGAGVGVNAGAGSGEGAGSVYVADAGTGQVVVFGLTEPEAPSVVGEAVSDITADSVDLGAEVNPRSERGEPVTEYRFEYGPCGSASDCAESGYGSETRIGVLAAGFEAEAVSAHVGGLRAGTTYHFRALASNELGNATPGPERVFRTQGSGGSLVLPDNRGWELVSPPDKKGALIEPIAEIGVVEAAADGGGITYLTNSPTESEPAGYTNTVQVLSRRGAFAWSSGDIAIPHSGATGVAVGPGPEYKLFNPQLTLSIVQPFGEFIPVLSPEASESTAYLHELSDSCDGSCYRPLVTGKAGVANVPEGTVFGEEEKCIPSGTHKSGVVCGPEFVGASEDLSHVVLFAHAALTPGAGAKQLYEWSGGVLAHVSVLPNGEAAPADARLGLENRAVRGAISADGSRIVWEGQAGLYQRDMVAPASTVQLDEAECGLSEGCESGGGSFEFASAEGTRVFFSDTHKLTVDSGASAEAGKLKVDLYECAIVPAGEGHERCELTDLTPKHGSESAEVQGEPDSQGGVLGASEDGEYVYFVAKGVQSEIPNGRGQSPQPGHPNLYLRHGMSTIFIATLTEGDGHDWSVALSNEPTRVSPNGRFLELMSEASLTGYDNRDVATSKPTAEVYLYDAIANSLVCASCDPTGARPVGVEYHKLEPGSGGLVGGGRGTWESKALVAANVPGWTTVGLAGSMARYQPRYLSNSGRLFFNTINALVPQDSNGTQDVYEYDPLGLESSEGKSVCEASSPEFSSASNGCVALISSGSSAQESAFMDASESGDDAFFLTSAKLSPLDVDASQDIYDAHVCTTAEPCITFPNVQSPPCTTEASCKPAPTPQPAVFGAPPSATFQGLGNPAPAAPTAVKAKAKTLTRAQKLKLALKACKKDKKAKRQACEKTARKRLGPVKVKRRAKKTRSTR